MTTLFLTCPACGMRQTDARETSCLKCDTPLRVQRTEPLLVIDIAHHGEDVDLARRKLFAAIDACRASRRMGLKVIHGQGTRTPGGGIKAEALRVLSNLVREGHARIADDDHNPGATIVYWR